MCVLDMAVLYVDWGVWCRSVGVCVNVVGVVVGLLFAVVPPRSFVCIGADVVVDFREVGGFCPGVGNRLCAGQGGDASCYWFDVIVWEVGRVDGWFGTSVNGETRGDGGGGFSE